MKERLFKLTLLLLVISFIFYAVPAFAKPDTVPPVVTAFDLPTTSNSLTVPILTFTATDDRGVEGYMVTETPTAPDKNDPAWTPTAPTGYTFGSEGLKTLYAWAKDTRNVSNSLSDTVDITLVVDDPPVVTSFDIPATSNSLTVPILAFTATDDNGVTGYLVTESATAPSPGDPGWSGTPQTSYTFSSEGSKTLYAWAKDTIDQVSAGVSDTVDIALPIDADTLDGLDSTAFTLVYDNVVIVEKNGKGDFIDPVAALNSITDASVSNPYLVKIMPGVYDIGENQLIMKSYVDIEGSGESVTKITGTSESLFGMVKIHGVQNVEMRFLTVDHVCGIICITVSIGGGGSNISLAKMSIISTGGLADSRGINMEFSTPSISDVTITTGTTNSYGIWMSNNASPIINNVRINASGTGILNQSGTLKVRNADITSNGSCVANVYVSGLPISELTEVTCVPQSPTVPSVNNSGGEITIHRSTIHGTQNQNNGITNIAVTQINGPINGTGYTCFQVYDVNFSEVICP